MLFQIQHYLLIQIQVYHNFTILKVKNKKIDVIVMPLQREWTYSPKTRRFNKEKLKIACQIIGCKPNSAIQIAEKIMEYFNGVVSNIDFSNDATSMLVIYAKKELFLEILKKNILEYTKIKKEHIQDFEIALDIIEQNRSIIVLLGGTSGSGKSTVASLLASRLGISTVLSTDSIRHIMRNFMSVEECPILFASTYEAGKKLRLKEDEDLSEKKKVLAGYQEQSVIVQRRLAAVNNFN